MSEIDLMLAIQLQAKFEEELRVSLVKQEEERKKQSKEGTPLFIESKSRKPLDEPQKEKLSVSLIDPSWELIDPNPDIHSLFLTFNDQFFWGRLAGVEVRWSPRMTLCAGVCCYEGHGGLCSVRLSLPLLKLRPRKDLVETLLHEMIHAYLFVTANNRDRDGHGPEFHKHMYRINGVAGTKITVFHTFHDEVDVYRQHIWKCDGPCSKRPPFFGLLKRSMNRAPGPRDFWWEKHQQTCGGTYIKIQEPERSGAAKDKTASNKNKAGSSNDIRKYMGLTGKGDNLNIGGVPKATHSGNTRGPADVNGNNESSKENTALGEVKKKGNNGSNYNPYGSKETQNNVKGLGSTGSGTVSKINVTGATRSNVHGFGGPSSPARKKPRVGNGVAAGKASGSKDSRGRGGFHGTAVRGRGGGSRTVTVKGKTNTQTETRREESTSIASSSTFQGRGYTLGGGTSKVSKLLSSSSASQLCSDSEDSSVSIQTQPEIQSGGQLDDTFRSSISTMEGNEARKRQKSLDCYITSSPPSKPVRKTVACPVCGEAVMESNINKHIDECLKNSDDCDAMEASEECEKTSSVDKTTCAEEGSSQAEREEKNEQYSCPVCGELCSPATINQHLDSHF